MCGSVDMKTLTFKKIIQKVRGKNFVWMKEISSGAMRELGERQEKRKKAEHFLGLVEILPIKKILTRYWYGTTVPGTGTGPVRVLVRVPVVLQYCIYAVPGQVCTCLACTVLYRAGYQYHTTHHSKIERFSFHGSQGSNKKKHCCFNEYQQSAPLQTP